MCLIAKVTSSAGLNSASGIWVYEVFSVVLSNVQLYVLSAILCCYKNHSSIYTTLYSLF